MNDLTTKTRRRGGGGAARRAERTSVKIETARFIERKIPNFEILSEEALEIVEANAETILEEVGVNFVNNPIALDAFDKAKKILSDLYLFFHDDPGRLKDVYKSTSKIHSVCCLDFIAGMSDEYALEIHKSIFTPKKWSFEDFKF